MPAAPRTDHTHVLLLRGINVGGHAKVPMAHLRQIATAAGAVDVSTHLNSGNVLFRLAKDLAKDTDGSTSAPSSSPDLTAQEVAANVQTAVARELGLTIPVIPASRADLGTALALHEGLYFAGGEPKLTHLFVLARPAEQSSARELEAFDAGADLCSVSGRFVWIRYATASHSSKLNVDRVERLLGTKATARNLLTVRHLAGVA